ncbi:tripartite tricarboxylate transporter substrate binding protein [bacterium]|nr:MAG: tripartite tricarboxylate transporter substrate binding protein [bacterium]
MKTRLYLYTLTVLLILAISLPAGADFPDRPITLIVNYTAGGGADNSCRAMAKKAEKFLGQPIVVVNKAGGAGSVGAGAVAAANPDGYTIGVLSFAPLTMVPHSVELPYNPLQDFDYIMGYGEYMYGIAVRTDSPFKTLKELVQYAKANPGKIKFSTSGLALPNTFGMIKLGKAEGGIKWDAVVFKGAPEAVSACLGGHVEVVSQNPADVVPYIKADRLRLLVSFADRRWEWVPDVPTLRELGYNFDVVGSWLALGTPKGVPKPAMDKLRDAFKKAIDDPDFLEIMKRLYIPVAYRTPEQYRKMVEVGYKENEAMMLEVGLHKSQQKK